MSKAISGHHNWSLLLDGVAKTQGCCRTCSKVRDSAPRSRDRPRRHVKRTEVEKLCPGHTQLCTQKYILKPHFGGLTEREMDVETYIGLCDLKFFDLSVPQFLRL